MNNIDLNTAIAFAALLIAVSSPIITAVANNIHSNRMFKKEFFYKHRAEVIERYLHSVAVFASGEKPGTYKNYRESAAEIYLYIDEDLWPTLSDIEDLIVKCEKIDSTEQRQQAALALVPLLQTVAQGLAVENPRKCIKNKRRKKEAEVQEIIKK